MWCFIPKIKLNSLLTLKKNDTQTHTHTHTYMCKCIDNDQDQENQEVSACSEILDIQMQADSCL